MAVGPFLRQGLEELIGSGKCLGLHASINSEWDRIKWIPCSPREEIRTLLDEEGEFPEETAWFTLHPPDLEQVMKELNAQLDYLTSLGVPVSYVDMHMMPYEEIPGFAEEMSGWIRRKGLIDHLPYYRTPAQFEPSPSLTPEEGERHWEAWFRMLEDGTYFTVTHPFRLGEDSFLMGNKDVPAETCARRRDTEYRLLSGGTLEKLAERYGVTPVRYDQL